MNLFMDHMKAVLSEGRKERGYAGSVADLHQKKIALDTLRMSKVGAMVAGGMDHGQAIAYLLTHGYDKRQLELLMKKYSHTDSEIADMFSKTVTENQKEETGIKFYRPDVYGKTFKIDIDKVKPGNVDTLDGEFGYHRKGDKIVYDSNDSELTTHHLWDIEKLLS